MDSHGKKRAAPGELGSGRDRKKVRLADARHISVQNVALPSTVSIEKFVEVSILAAHVRPSHQLTFNT